MNLILTLCLGFLAPAPSWAGAGNIGGVDVSTSGVTVVDTEHGTKLHISDQGRIEVIVVPAEAPADTLAISTSAFGDVASTSGVDFPYTITAGSTLTIQEFTAGAEYDSAGSVVELYWDPAGDMGSQARRIEVLFVNAASANVPIAEDFVGDGTARIVLRRRGFTAVAREMFGRWKGYETPAP